VCARLCGWCCCCCCSCGGCMTRRRRLALHLPSWLGQVAQRGCWHLAGSPAGWNSSKSGDYLTGAHLNRDRSQRGAGPSGLSASSMVVCFSRPLVHASCASRDFRSALGALVRPVPWHARCPTRYIPPFNSTASLASATRTSPWLRSRAASQSEACQHGPRSR